MVLLVFSCVSSKNTIKEPSVKNPTFYIFAKSKQDVEIAIIEVLGGSESSKRSKFDDYMLVQYRNRDFKLICNPGNSSKVYFRKNGEPYLYSPSRIQILIDSIAENTTKVSIDVLTPEVRTGLTLLPTIPWLQRGWKYKEVPSTTVEEYEILLMIGKELNEANMPELKIPDKIVF